MTFTYRVSRFAIINIEIDILNVKFFLRIGRLVTDTILLRTLTLSPILAKESSRILIGT